MSLRCLVSFSRVIQFRECISVAKTNTIELGKVQLGRHSIHWDFAFVGDGQWWSLQSVCCKQLHFFKIKGLGVRSTYASATDNNGRTMAASGCGVRLLRMPCFPNKDLPGKKGGVIMDYASASRPLHASPSLLPCESNTTIPREQHVVAVAAIGRDCHNP